MICVRDGRISAMDHAGLIDVWNLSGAIVARQTPFAQIMITVGAAFFVVMAIEGIRTSILAIRNAAVIAPPVTGSRMNLQEPDIKPDRAARLFAARPVSRPPARPVRKAARITPVASAKRLTLAIRRQPRLDSSGHSTEATSF
jgi:hypothetical protein